MKQGRVGYFSKKAILPIYLLLVIILGAFFRFYRVGKTLSIMYDTARDLQAVQRMIETQKPTLLGPETSIGLWSERQTYFGPLHYYLILPPIVLFSKNVLAAVVFTGIVNLMGAVVIYFLLKNISITAAIIGSALYIFSPLSVQYSRFIWNPNWLIPFVSFSLFFFFKGIKKCSLLFLFLAGLMAGLDLQLHYITVPLSFVLLIMLWLWGNKKKKQKFLNSLTLVGGVITGFLSVILFELRHQFFITKALLFHFTRGEAKFSFSFLKVVQNFRSLVGRFFGLTDYSLISMIDRYSFWSDLVTAGLFVLIFPLIIFALKDLYFEPKKKSIGWSKENTFLVLTSAFYLLLGLFFAVVWELMGKGRSEDRYLLPLIPPLIIILSLAFNTIIFRIKRGGKFIVGLVIFLLLVTMTIKDFRIITQNPGINQRDANYYGVQKIAQVIAKDVKENNLNYRFNVANIVDGNTRATYYRYFLYLNKVHTLPVEQYPNAFVLYVITKSKDRNYVLNYPVWEIISFSPQKADLLADLEEYDIRIFKLLKNR